MKCYRFVLLETPKTGPSNIGCDPRDSTLTRGTRESDLWDSSLTRGTFGSDPWDSSLTRGTHRK